MSIPPTVGPVRDLLEGSCCGAGYANVDSLPASPDESDNLEPPPPARYRVVMLGDAGVGKTALVNQFMTSEYMHTYDASLGKSTVQTDFTSMESVGVEWSRMKSVGQ